MREEKEARKKPNRFFEINEQIRANPEIIMDIKEAFKLTYTLMHTGSITPEEKISLDSIIRTLYNEIRLLKENQHVTVSFCKEDVNDSE